MKRARSLRGRRAEIIELRGRYYILASSSLADDRTRALKHGETFAVFDRSGDVHPTGRGQQGLYHEGSRYLSRLELRIDGERPILLSSTVTEENAQIAVDLTNPNLVLPSDVILPQDSLHILRSAVLWQGTCYQQIRIRSYALEPIAFGLALLFDADFVDIFEVRGVERARRGERRTPEVREGELRFAYVGLDGVSRQTIIRFDPVPTSLETGEARFGIALGPGGEARLELEVVCDPRAPRPDPPRYEFAARAARVSLIERSRSACRIDSANEQFNDWLNRSTADLRMMLTETEHGLYPYAGVPWFSTPFGRDGIITALEMLWVDPSIAAAVLRFLAATQAREEQPESDAEPGKILHEARSGEMSALGEVPFRRYYGTIDATPLFVFLAHAYFERSGDRALIEEIWPNLLAALEWIERYGDRDGDGFVEYERHSATGLVNQGWKDSHDSVFHSDGRLAEGPIALCEVQAYVFGAWQAAAQLAEVLGESERAWSLRGRAEKLRRAFEEKFWSDELGSYVLALDGHKRPCSVRASNAGHCLLTGIADFPRAETLATGLMQDAFFSGWGVRTLPEGAPRYNPMSYHNGSVWPHDNALIAAGMARYGHKDAVLRILTGLLDATLFLDLHRIPELFCGFRRRPGEGPTLYPVACAPQSWAAGTIFLLLQACLGLRISASERRILFATPVLPPFLDGVRIRGLCVGDGCVDLELRRHPDDVGIQVVHRQGDVDVVVVK
ncbi:MAG: glycogen debranching N-terminal domain-containing protein [Myxococcota bacterium]